MLDLTGWDIEKDGSVSLNGEWEFYWQGFLSQQDFDKPDVAENKLLVTVPDTWDKYENGGKSLPRIRLR
jgi:hypothetical protein